MARVLPTALLAVALLRGCVGVQTSLTSLASPSHLAAQAWPSEWLKNDHDAVLQAVNTSMRDDDVPWYQRSVVKALPDANRSITDRPDILLKRMCVVLVSLLLLALASRSCVNWPATRQSNLWYGSAALFVLWGSTLGFVPGLFVAMTSGHWYADAFARTNQPAVMDAMERLGGTWSLILWSHVVIAFLWTVLASLQVFTGALGWRDHTKMWYHRKAGYVVASAGIVAMMFGLTLQHNKRSVGPSDGPGASISTHFWTMFSAVALIFNVIVGIRYVRAKDIQNHKVAMAYACVWGSDAGALRLISYFISYATGRSKYEQNVVCVAIGLWTILELALMFSAWVAVRDFRLNMLNINSYSMIWRLVMNCIWLMWVNFPNRPIWDTYVVAIVAHACYLIPAFYLDNSARAAADTK